MNDNVEKRRILIVDDMPINVQLLSAVLKSRYHIKVAVDGLSALNVATSDDPPDLVLLDIMMPGMDGYEVCRRLKEKDETRHIPVIFITALTETENETLGFDVGGVDYITKPFNPSIVLSRVKTHLELKATRERLEKQNEELQKLNREMQDDLVLAREVQSATMNFISDLPFLLSAVVFRPYAEVSGDFYDVTVGGTHDSLSLFLGDATGHGVSAALVTMMVKMGLSSLPYDLATDEVLRRLNRMLKSCIPVGRFLTGVYMRITSDGFVTSSNAGHPPLLIVPSDGKETVVFEAHGLPLGIFAHEHVPYEVSSYGLEPGDKLFLYTDGVTECSRAKEDYGSKRLISFLENHRSLDIKTLLDRLMEELAAFTGEDRFQDDLALIGLQYL